MFTFLLEDTTQAAAGSTMMSAFGSIAMIFIFLGLMYFMVMRPQKKREKELRAQMDAMKIGDTIITIGGIVGVLASQDDDTVTIYSSVANTPIKFQKAAIQTVVPRDGVNNADKKVKEKKEKKEKRSEDTDSEE
ncbi:MAG: preprotein translocase subunit YajC [Clostridiales bacterium]|nr:preprotein translocase subunit YajC [Clostridiales bacterium]